MRRFIGGVLVAYGAANLAACDEPSEACSEAEGMALYEQRIAPLLAEDRPSSCNSCHLSGIDLDRYALGDPCRTMACMVEEGLVSLEDPESSTVLGWIARAEPDSALVTESVIAEEYDGFKAWIEWSATCGAQACGEIENPCVPEGEAPVCEEHDERDPSAPPEHGDPGDCSDLTLETLFRDRVYVHRGRCAPCHVQGADLTGPDWVRAGACNEASLATMRWLLEHQLVDAQSPADSLLLLKPLDEADGGVEHGGHHKFADTSDPAYNDMLYWLERWASCQTE